MSAAAPASSDLYPPVEVIREVLDKGCSPHGLLSACIGSDDSTKALRCDFLRDGFVRLPAAFPAAMALRLASAADRAQRHCAAGSHVTWSRVNMTVPMVNDGKGGKSEEESCGELEAALEVGLLVLRMYFARCRPQHVKLLSSIARDTGCFI